MHDSDRRRGRAARPGSPRAKVLNVVRVSSGNFLEMFDFMVFGYYASSIGRTFFPNENAPAGSNYFYSRRTLDLVSGDVLAGA
jgi:hypothetical protein